MTGRDAANSATSSWHEECLLLADFLGLFGRRKRSARRFSFGGSFPSEIAAVTGRQWYHSDLLLPAEILACQCHSASAADSGSSEVRGGAGDTITASDRSGRLLSIDPGGRFEIFYRPPENGESLAGDTASELVLAASERPDDAGNVARSFWRRQRTTFVLF